MMCKLSAEKCCRQLTLFSEGSPVRTSVLQEMEKVWRESEVVYSTKLSASQKKFDRLLSSLKMYQPLELEDLSKLSKHLPKSGMIVGGRVLLPQALELHIKERDGSYLPTPTAQSYGTNKGGAAGRIGKERMSLNTMAARNMWPTPCARDWKDSPGQKFRENRDHSKLAMQVYSQDNGGQLNPRWVEWLMGYEIDHTELNALGIAWFRSKSGKRL